MRPLGIVLSWNRLDALRTTIESLKATTSPRDLFLVVVDNGSTDGSAKWLTDKEGGIISKIELLPRNIGCPAGFNYVLKHYRQPGQPVAKIDGDVKIVTKDWVPKMAEWEQVSSVGIASPWFWGAYDERILGSYTHEPAGLRLEVADFIPGHLMWITAHAMDKLGYFDVLGTDHFYGYDDVLFVVRCQQLGMLMGIDRRVDAHHMEHPAGKEPELPDGMRQKAHAAWIREWYVERLEKYQSGELDCYVGQEGGL